MNLNSLQKSVNRESHYAQVVGGTTYPIIDLNNPVLVVSVRFGGDELTQIGAERVEQAIHF